MNQYVYDWAELTLKKKKNLLHRVRWVCSLSYNQQKEQGEKMIFKTPRRKTR